MRYFPTKDQIADILTKAIKGEQFSKLKTKMGMMAFDSEDGTTSRPLASEALIAYELPYSKGSRAWNSFWSTSF